MPPQYPTAPTSDQLDDYHGERIADRYRQLEDSDAPESRDWIEAENALTDRVLADVPARREIQARLAELWDHPRAGAPWRRGERWFQLRNTGLQD
jgi:prolyl oligopeptidase